MLLLGRLTGEMDLPDVPLRTLDPLGRDLARGDLAPQCVERDAEKRRGLLDGKRCWRVLDWRLAALCLVCFQERNEAAAMTLRSRPETSDADAGFTSLLGHCNRPLASPGLAYRIRLRADSALPPEQRSWRLLAEAWRGSRTPGTSAGR